MSTQKPAISRSCLIWMLVLLLIGAPILLVAAYYITGNVIANQIENDFSEHNCNLVLEKSPFLEKYYPEKIAPFVEPIPTMEAQCQSYVDAVNLQEGKKWGQAYQSFMAYLKKYPKGELAKDAQEAAGATLYAWVLEHETGNNFEDAEERMLFLLDEHPTTTAAKDGEAYLPTLYLHWAQYLDSNEEFQQAEAKLLYLADEYPESSAATAGELYLAEVYLHWGQNLREKGSFESAEEMLKKVRRTDPDPTAANSPAFRADKALASLYRGWGDQLMENRSFSDAIAKYLTLQQRLPVDQRNEVRALLADAYLKWSDALQKADDFNGALSKTRTAETYAVDANQESEIDELNTTITYNFAHSGGEQAQEIMDNAGEFICNNGSPYSSSLIALTDDNVKVYFNVSYISGASYSISKTLKADTPASMHYVACVTREKTKIQTCPYRTSSGKLYYVERYRVTWDVILRDAKTGESVGQQQFNGANPKICPYTETFSTASTTKTYTGENPVDAVEAWIEGLLP